jgi:hypothetical protein
MQVQFVSKDHTALRAPNKARYQMEEVTFRKTIAGHNEFEHRHVLHRAELRRLLILIDGKKSLDVLVAYFREFEFTGLLSELFALGMIEPVSEDHVFCPITVQEELAARSALKPMQFEAARRAAMHAASELLGTVARPYCANLVACQDSMTLRAVLSDIQEKLIETLGNDAATLFIETVRDAVKITR